MGTELGTPIETLAVDKVIALMGTIVAPAYDVNVTPARVYRGQKILPAVAALGPCISVWPGIVLPDDGDEPRSLGSYFVKVPLSIAFAWEAKESEVQQKATTFIASIDRALAKEGEALGAQAFMLAVPKYPDGTPSETTVWWKPAGAAAFVGDALPNHVFGTADYNLRVPRSIYRADMA
jgi:hypothetical protein